MAETPNPEPRTDAPLLPPAPARAEPQASADMVRLALRVEEFERRLKARTLELETEIRSKERLRGRVTELTKRSDELQETAAALHREAVSATALSRELDETLRVASEARRQLGEALAAERIRREDAEKDVAASRASVEALRESEARAEASLAASTETRARAEAVAAEAQKRIDAAVADARGRAEAAVAEARGLAETAVAEARVRADAAAKRLASLEPELKQRDAELKDARLHLHALRQKSDGHEAHIDSLRAELDAAREEAADAAALVERARRFEAEAAEAARLRAALEKTNQERAEERGRLESELRAVREKSREVLENAEAIRREGVEAFESSREMKLRLEVEEDKLRREHAAQQSSARASAELDELQSLKAELRDRAERESRELRDALDAERARLYQDLDAERRAHESASSGAEKTDERVRRLHAESDERREGIEREVRGYLQPAPKPAASVPPPPPSPAPASASVPAAAPARPATKDPALREPWQTRDEMKFLLWIAVGVGLVAVLVASVLFFQG